MKIGYACIFLGDEQSRQRTCTLKYITEEKLQEIISHNLQALRRILAFNAAHNIMMYRLSSDIIPFGSSPVNTLPWQSIYRKELEEIGNFVKEKGMRVSSHPGQYTILNALNVEIIERSKLDLEYHCSILDMMGLDSSHKMVLHIGGIYNDKDCAMQRFIDVYRTLPEHIQRRLVIENDDRYYTVEDVLKISSYTHIPVVFDNLHHEILPPEEYKSIGEWLTLVRDTWKKEDGVQKVHYSEQAVGKRLGAHAQHVTSNVFFSFLAQVPFDVDVMLEVKDKNISACKIQCLLEPNIACFYEEWKYYKYLFYLHSLADYTYYEYLFSEHKDIDRMDFYQLAERYLREEVMNENYRMLFQFIKRNWQDIVSERSMKLYIRMMENYCEKNTSSSLFVSAIYRIATREQLVDEIAGLILLQMLV
ncbi:UV DNA damage repair endonuclease UvsE [Amedibacillus sp. YH-ame10]